jgi:hypothetical protein
LLLSKIKKFSRVEVARKRQNKRSKHTKKELKKGINSSCGKGVSELLFILKRWTVDNKNFRDHVNNLKDTRDCKKIKYSLFEIVLSLILMSFLKIPSRNQYNGHQKADIFCKTIEAFFGIKLAHGDTLYRNLEHIPESFFSECFSVLVKQWMIQGLFNSSRVNGCLTLIVDGTGIGSATKQTQDWSVTRQYESGRCSNSRQLIRVEILGPNGISIPLGWEPICIQDG